MFIILWLQNLLSDNVGAQIAQGLFNHCWHIPPDGFYFNKIVWILLSPFGEQYNFYLSLREEMIGAFAEHHCCHIFDEPSFGYRF